MRKSPTRDPKILLAFSAQQLFALPTSHWLHNGSSLSNQRYAPLDSLTPAKVAA